MKIQEKYMEQAVNLHRNYPVVDAHLDLAAELFCRKMNGEENPLRDHYLENFRKGGFNLICSSIFLENEQLPEGGLRAALDQISALLESIDQNEEFLPVRTKQDLDQAIREDRIGILMYMEGLDCIGNDLGLLRILWELGVRGASLTWSRRNMFGSGCCKASQRIQIPGGLSPDGFQAVKEMERLGMFLDISHLNDDGFEDVCRTAAGPFAATHSNSQAIFFNYRNLTDEQIRALAAQGGIMGLNNCDRIVGCEHEGDPLEMMCRHVEYEVHMIGDDRVGYGFDFCDSFYNAEPKMTPVEYHMDCLVNHGRVPELTAALLQRGMPTESVIRIIGGNWVEYFRRMLPENKA